MADANQPVPHLARPAAPAAPKPPGAPADAPAPLAAGGLQWFREIVTAAIAIAIAAVALGMMVVVFMHGGETVPGNDKELHTAKTEAYNRQKDVMLYALALLGTVTGYYLGRVPAELHAQQAQQTAAGAQEQRDEARQQQAKTKADAKATVRSVLGRLPAAAKPVAKTLGGGGGGGGAGATPDELALARDELENLMDRLD